jgi:hypothetical protein
VKRNPQGRQTEAYADEVSGEITVVEAENSTTSATSAGLREVCNEWHLTDGTGRVILLEETVYGDD